MQRYVVLLKRTTQQHFQLVIFSPTIDSVTRLR